jgi:hypothetical protein
VFSFGVTLVACLKNGKAYHADEKFSYNRVAHSALRPAIPDGTPEFIGELARRCWAENPDERPTFVEITAQLEQLIGVDGALSLSSPPGNGDGEKTLAERRVRLAYMAGAGAATMKRRKESGSSGNLFVNQHPAAR